MEDADAMDVDVTALVVPTAPTASSTTTTAIAKSKTKMKKELTTMKRKVQNQKRAGKKAEALAAALKDEKRERLAIMATQALGLPQPKWAGGGDINLVSTA
jgi:hypothetical protein